MRRRTFLGSAAIAALAGCSNGESSESTGTPTRTATEAATPTATDAPAGTGTAEFAFDGVDAPGSVEVGQPTGFAVRVENVGSGRGTFTSGLSAKVGDGEWRPLDAEVSLTLGAGESGVWETSGLTFRYLTTVTYRLDALDETWTTEVGAKRLSFGEGYATPHGLRISVLGGSFESSYPTGGDGTPAPDGDVWLVMRVDVRNRLQEPIETPPASTFTLEVGGERRDLRQSVTDDPYEASELPGRTIRRGDLVYAVPEGTTADDVAVTWSQSTPEGDLRAVWSV